MPSSSRENNPLILTFFTNIQRDINISPMHPQRTAGGVDDSKFQNQYGKKTLSALKKIILAVK